MWTRQVACTSGKGDRGHRTRLASRLHPDVDKGASANAWVLVTGREAACT